MNIYKLETLEQFKELKKGDRILVKWGECPMKEKKISFYNIPMVQHKENEIICNVKQNIYFNYKMHLGLENGDGICRSNAKEVYFIGESNE
jgi:hypothetical protein